MFTSEVAVVKSHHGISVKCSRYRDTGTTDPSLLSTSKRPPTSECPPYISLLEVKDKCFYLSTKWAFTGISGLLKKRPKIEINYENIKL